MSKPLPPAPAKLFFSLFARDEYFIDQALSRLKGLLGPVDYLSPLLPFDQTSYYEKEFGPELKRRFASFSQLIPQESIVAIKHLAWKIEKELSEGRYRRVNIDPGYVLLERLVLVTFKNFSHRIYLGQGVYAEVTLLFRHGQFQPLPWTYPDYAAPEAREIFLEIRNLYKEQLMAWRREHAQR